MESWTLNLAFVVILCLPCPCFSATFPAAMLQKAADVLANARFTSMALTLELISETSVLPESSSLTIFSPNDAAFSHSGQPTLSLLRLHFCPSSLPSGFLRSLPFGTEIPTTLWNGSLVVSSLPSDANFTLNGVKIDRSPLYWDEVLMVYGISSFFDPSFQVSRPLQGPTPDLRCASRIKDGKRAGSNLPGHNPFDGALKVMRKGGYSVMASFLAMQLLGFEYKTRTLTLFAPIDKALSIPGRNVSELMSLFLHHVVPCKLTRTDLTDFIRGPAIPTYSQGFKIRVRVINNTMMINRVRLDHPELYRSDWIVVHGTQGVLGAGRSQHRDASPKSEKKKKNDGSRLYSNTWGICVATILSFLGFYLKI
ncbi:hypothetical protein MLD38_017521 [Melastoma candidum]|uniref:Uncharacterized protein n=1 Tax=Melastoma candidum TaxID=119954 RepID=A0ACB9QQT3_9MYRT|nr:hypothetical protein MLD38_017521 [Melastoma candidum]